MFQGGWDKRPFGEAKRISIDNNAVKVPILDWPSKFKFCSLCKGTIKEWYVHWAWRCPFDLVWGMEVGKVVVQTPVCLFFALPERLITLLKQFLVISALHQACKGGLSFVEFNKLLMRIKRYAVQVDICSSQMFCLYQGLGSASFCYSTLFNLRSVRQVKSVKWNGIQWVSCLITQL